jgi:proteic killer suppression protein
MIVHFKDKRLRDFYNTGSTKGLNSAHIKKLRFIIASLDVANKSEDLSVPSLRLHPLIGDLKDYWSVTVAANWRIIFKFEGADITNVDLVDYH